MHKLSSSFSKQCAAVSRRCVAVQTRAEKRPPVTLETLADMVAPMAADVKAMIKDIDSLKTGQDSLKTAQDSLKTGQDSLWESIARTTVAKMFGERFSRQFTVKSLQDLAVLAAPAGADAPDVDTPSVSGTEIAKQAHELATELLKTGAIEALLNRITDALVRTGVVPAGSTHEQAKAAVGQRPYLDTPTRLLMERLLKARKVSDPNGLVECKSCGIAVAVYVADRATFDAALNDVTDASEIAERLPSTEVEFDVRGRIDIVDRANFCAVACGEIKNSPSVAHAQRQLVSRCHLLRWAVQTLKPNLHVVVMVGRIFAPKAFFKQAGQKLSDVVEDVSIYKHPI